MLLLGLVLRLWFMRIPGYSIDVTLFTEWTDGLLKIPWGEYFGLVAPWCDYLPGYLYLLAATGWVKTTVVGGGVLPVQAFEPWIKIGPIMADLVLAATIYALVRRFTSSNRSLLAASLIVLNPSILFVGAVWGQVESIAAALYMLALLSLVSGSPILAAVWAGVGFATKPQYAVFLVPAGVAYTTWTIRHPSGDTRRRLAWLARRALIPVAALVATVQLLIVPFSLSLWPSAGADWTFAERVTMAEIGSFASAGAFNFWGTQVAGIRKLDSVQGWFSVTYEVWGYVMFAGVAALSVAIAWKRSNRPEAVLWSSFLLAFGFFEVVTKMHERYLFAAIVLLAAVSAFRPWAAAFCAALSALYFVNLWYMWTYNADLFANLRLTQWASDFSVILFLVAVVAAASVGLWRRDSLTTTRGLWDAGLAEETSGVAGPASWRTFWNLNWRVVLLTAGATALLLILALWSSPLGLGVRNAGQGDSSQTATVRAFRSYWQDSGVKVSAGDKVTISAQGRWDHKHEGDLYGPAGNGDIPDWTVFPTAPTGALLGRIGNSEPFLVGEGLTFTARESGSLLFVMNDGRKGYDDNRGRVQVTITVARP